MFCPACTPDATDDRPVTVEGRLTITIDPRTGMRMLTFVAGDHDLENLSLETRSMEPPATTNDPDSTEDEGEEETEDDDPTEDPIPDPDHVLIPFRSNRADRVFHFDDGEGTPCCEFTGEYEPVAAFLIFSLSTL